MVQFKALLLLFTLAIFSSAYQRPKEDFLKKPKLWPMPNKIDLGEGQTIIKNPCEFSLKVTGPADTTDIKLFEKAFHFYKERMFPGLDCGLYDSSAHNLGNFIAPDQGLDSTITETLHVKVNETTAPEYPQLFMNENYTLNVNSSGIFIDAGAYWGYVRGLETLSQLIYSMKIASAHSKMIYYVPATPISIEDWPNMKHRGVMLDSSRHYLSVDALKRTIEGLAYNRMNVLHWHIIDADSFPVWLTELPNVTKAGAFSKRQTYHPEQITEVVEHGRMLGVRIIPEIESPGHTRSWALADEFQDILSCRTTNGYCAQPPCGQIIPTMNKTMQLVGTVIDQILKLFPENVVHFGGDEVMTNCWATDNRLQGVNHFEMAVNFQKAQKKLIGKKRAMFWGDSPYKGDLEDVVQMWSGGAGASVGFYWIASYASAFYLDCGLGNLFGSDGTWCEPLKTWLMIYRQTLDSEMTSPRFLGVENPLFAEMNSDATVDQKVWPRVASTGEITWTKNHFNPDNTADAVERLTFQVKRMIKRGIKAFPPTMTFCEVNLDQCWPSKKKTEN